jgi:site-specific recombinase XerD
MPNSEFESWTLLGDDHVPVESVERFLAYLASIEKSPNTIKAYAHDLKDWLTYLGGHGVSWQSVTLEDVAGFVAWLRLPPEARDGRVTVLPTVEHHCSPASVNRKLAALTSFCEFHARHGVALAGLLVTMQPAGRRGAGSATSYKPFLHHVTKSGPQRRRAIKLKTSRPRPKVLTAAEAQTILDTCDHLRDRLLFALLLDCGVRIGEALGLRHEDMGIAERAVTVTPRPNDNRARQGGYLPDRPGQRRADAALRRLPHPRVRLAGLRLRLRQSVVAAPRPPVDLRRRLRLGHALAQTDWDRL